MFFRNYMKFCASLMMTWLLWITLELSYLFWQLSWEELVMLWGML